MAYDTQCVQPGVQHFLKKFVGADGNPAELHTQMAFFKTACLFHPHPVANNKPTKEGF